MRLRSFVSGCAVFVVGVVLTFASFVAGCTAFAIVVLLAESDDVTVKRAGLVVLIVCGMAVTFWRNTRHRGRFADPS